MKGGVVAYLQVDGATKAAEFYRRAFGAQVVAAHPVDDKGRTMHVHLHVNGSSVMLCDSYPEYGHPSEKPQAFNLTLMVDDIDAWWRRASMPVPRSSCRSNRCSGARGMASSAIRSGWCGR